MPITPNLIERSVFYTLNVAPAPMLDLFGAMAFRALTAAARLGVFEALADGPRTAVQLARRIEADELGTRVLLDALASVGYVRKGKNGAYALTAMAAKWLPGMAEGVPFAERMVFEQWRSLEGRVRGAEPPGEHYEDGGWTEDTWREFQSGMIAAARANVDPVARAVKLPSGARQLLDVGGGHGLYAIAFCKRNPQLAATVFDFPEALEITKETIEAEGMTSRVTTQPGDFWTDALGSGYDVALLFNIVHSNQPDRNVELFRKVASALVPGGLLVILDQLSDSRGTGPAARAIASLMSLNMYIGTGGQAYASREIFGWLRQAGLEPVRRINLMRSPGNGLVLATKPA